MTVNDILDKFPGFNDVLKCMPRDIDLHIEKFSPDTVIVQKGDIIKKLMLISSGDMIVYNEYEGGEIIYVQSKDITFIGDIELLSKIDHYVCSVISKNECTAIVMSCNDFLRWYQEDNNLSREIAERLAKRNCKQAQQVGSLKYHSTDYRVAKYLCDMIKDKFDTESSVTVKITKEALAYNVGASERMVYRVIRQMKDDDFITTGYGYIKLTKLQYERLRKLLK
ncbi:cyclic nucleotide-binding domain-containing protein [Clostridiaceae bacterium M8S5]|nr:cyclic nucleotide-binding domain-containing protein [Clostridiaceae bacterium M8S5]